jgi:lysophospholipase L1-like esterase
MKGILAVGDCITRGIKHCFENSYPEQVGRALNIPVKNCGRAMCSSKEGIFMLEDNDSHEFDYVFIQFGLKDAYSTFKYSPNILYYPDNFFRKQVRKIVKKYKKACKKNGLNNLLGEVCVVPEQEYRNNVSLMVERCKSKLVVLPEIIPHQEIARNNSIQRYNTILEDIAKTHDNCIFVRLFDDFLKKMPQYYLDMGHPNEFGYSYISGKILEHLDEVAMKKLAVNRAG